MSQISSGTLREYRATLARLVSEGLVAKTDGGTFQLSFPVWRCADSEVLMPVVDEVVGPLAEELVKPVWADLNRLLDDMGYAHRRDQYGVWRDWLGADIMGHALGELVKQGVLPELGDSPPAKWEYAAWKGQLPMTTYMVAS